MTFCSIYRSGKMAETYLYLSEGLAYDDLPADLRAAFGEPSFVMALKLEAGRRLARVDVRLVLERLGEPGYFLQLPPEMPVEEEISRRFAGPVKD